jgi:AcrR family transcriptional regulator
MTERKPKRRTRERVLETSLRLFNDFGEPNVTTTVIADEMNISPGNLYYHFRNKDEIVNEIFAAFEKEIDALLALSPDREVNVEDVWLFLHVMFETIWKYRFLYRDLSDLLSRNRLLETHFKRILADKVRTTTGLCGGLARAGVMRTDDYDLEALATNMMVIATYWLSYAYVRDPRNFSPGAVLGQGVYQVMSMFAPYLSGDGRTLFARLAGEYLGQ